MRLRPGNHVNVLAQLDALDVEFAGLWVGAIYEGMYTRGVLDDRTRVLCMVGDCLAASETENSPQHMRGALREGATPAEVLDVILLSSAIAGIPHVVDVALDHFVKVLDDLGRAGERWVG